MASLIFTAISAARIGHSLHSSHQKSRSRQQCIDAINLYWSQFADPKSFAGKIYHDMKIHVDKARQHAIATNQLCAKNFSQKDMDIMVEPMRNHYNNQLTDTLQSMSLTYAKYVFSEILEIMINRRTISIMNHLRIVINHKLINDYADDKIRALPGLIKEFNVEPFSRPAMATSISKFITLMMNELDVLPPSLTEPACDSTLNIFTSRDPGFLNHIFLSIRNIITQEVDTINESEMKGCQILDLSDKFSLKSLKEDPKGTVILFKKFWQMQDPITYTQFMTTPLNVSEIQAI